ncbi:hypothetical protein CBF_2679 [Clostridium botulinum F str. 230613]|uniref:Uncharacterized protein n=1 Tax=Clostridium botulinum (strain Langeland / NCTC 10281 / Type F) TaxID=441772 RepID=A7GGL1_CLOBL|nr:hypothetical protein CLI_2687 [Clostridium botulinum F str. Langeland]ADG00319.1 hypothetical protein CBF_2679 [Clostridium botulinum F str. 230613]
MYKNKILLKLFFPYVYCIIYSIKIKNRFDFNVVNINNICNKHVNEL